MNLVTMLIILGVLVTTIYQLICAGVASSIAAQKKYNRAVFFVLALLMLGPLNIAVALLAPPQETADSK
ncbi:MAG: hypothetical protein QOH60_1271 [Mycobacterium sp.]|nr:hypothetical protein [Mycobacterium sp.]